MRGITLQGLEGLRDYGRDDVPWLLERYAATGDASYCEAVIEIHRPLAISRAQKMLRNGTELDDLIQVALEGMWKAAKRFRPEGGASFPTFAVRTMDGELKRYYRDCGWDVHVPRGLKNLALKVSRAHRNFVATEQREPTLEELAARLEIPLEDVVRGLDAGRSYSSTSLNTPVTEGSTIGDLLPDIETSPDRDLLLDVFDRLKRLPPKQRRIVYLRFYKDLSQREIAEQVGCSQMHVSRLLRRALRGIRDELDIES